MAAQSTRDFLVYSVFIGEHESLNLELKNMEKELVLKESCSSFSYIEFYKDDIRDLQKIISWIEKRIKEVEYKE